MSGAVRGLRGYYHALARPWGPSLASDQVIGGGTLWVLGDIIGLPFLAAVLIAMVREDESHAKVVDAELDESAAVAAGGSAVGGWDAGAADAGQRLWWQDDPRFTGRFAPVDPDAAAPG